MTKLKPFVVDRKKVVSLSTVRELQNYLDWLHPKSKKLMWHVFEVLHDEYKLECFNNNKTWGNDAKEVVKRSLTDPLSKICMGEVVARTGRSPFAIYPIWIWVMWEATRQDPKRVLLKRTIKSAVRYGYAQWSKSN